MLSQLVWLFSYAWKSLSISFCPIAFCRQFYFLFCVKDSLNRKKFVYHPQPTTCPTSYRAIWFIHIFSQRENFSLFDALFFVYRCFIFVVSLFIVSVPVVSLFILPWKPLFFLRLPAKLFSFCVKIPLFSLSNFSIKQAFLTLQRHYFCVPCFSFSSWKPLSVPLLISPYIRASAFHPALFSFCVKFSLNKQRKNTISLIILRCIVFFCVLQFSSFPVKITLFST